MSKKISSIIVQADEPYCYSQEVKACVTFGILNDIKVHRAYLKDLHSYAKQLNTEGCLPVGTVEFVKEAMQITNKQLALSTYPECFATFMPQKPRLSTVQDVLESSPNVFVKPVQTKLFTGFCMNHTDEHSLAQKEIFNALPVSTPVWVANTLDINQEWRVYVEHSNILAVARYDDFDSQDVSPIAFAKQVLEKNDISHAFSLDVAYLEQGSWVVVECNDAWALGLYGRALSPTQYVEFLWSRWQ